MYNDIKQPTEEEIFCSLLFGIPVSQDFIDAMKKLKEMCDKQNPYLN